ncbi:MAG: hypothetical protein H5T33_05995 [Candidatus Methanosuratus sp.]|nr:hypothetical protein [Candidatus Methanosuratincola sp.]
MGGSPAVGKWTVTVPEDPMMIESFLKTRPDGPVTETVTCDGGPDTFTAATSPIE